MFDSSCPAATVSGSSFTVTGEITYNADLTYTQDGTTTGSVSVSLPAACLTTNGVTLTCSQLNQALMAAMPSAGSTSCVAAGSGCTCTVALSAQPTTEAGTYTTTAAGLLTTIPTGGTASSDDYCIKGTTLTESPHAGAGSLRPAGRTTHQRQQTGAEV
jgi:hypothetical protein